MPSAAPRLDPRLLAALDALSGERVPIAEIARRIGAKADQLGVTRPSYQRVRELVHVRRRATGPAAADIVLDVAVRARPIADLGQVIVPARERRPLPRGR